MPKKPQEVQVVDLGSHVLKAVGMSLKGGKPVVDRGGFVALTDSFSDSNRYFNDVRSGLDALLNSGGLDRKAPIYFVVGEGLMPISIAYLNNQKPDGIDLSLEDSLSKFVAADGTSALEATLKKSFRLREKAQGGDVQVVAAHAYTRYDMLKELQEICVSRKVPFGGAFPKLFVYQEMFKQAFSGEPAVFNAITCVIDLGYNSANLVAFKEGKIVFHKALHMGARDYFNELRTLAAEKNFFQLTFPQFTDYMARVGLGGAPDRIASLGLPVTNPAAFEETANTVTEELCTKVRLSLDYFSTVSATDFNTSMATVMAVRKGAEHIFLTGGVVAVDGFMERAREQLADGVRVIDPMESLGGSVDGLPTLHFAAAVGGGLVALSDEADTYNVGLLLEGVGGGSAKGDTGEAFLEQVPKWAHAIALVVLLAVGYEYYEAFSSKNSLLAKKRDAQKELGEAKDFFTKYAGARFASSTNKVRLEFLREILQGRPAWGKIMKVLSEASTGLVKVTRLETDTSYPKLKGMRTPDGNFEGKRESLQVGFKLSGEAKSRDAVFTFSKKLTESGHFADLEQPQLVEASTGMNPFNPDSSQTVVTDCQFYFQIAGTLKAR